jgi:hypothetical protein
LKAVSKLESDEVVRGKAIATFRGVVSCQREYDREESNIMLIRNCDSEILASTRTECSLARMPKSLPYSYSFVGQLLRRGRGQVEEFT